jgi:hypothetical protein
MVHTETVFWLTECVIWRWEVHMVSKTACMDKTLHLYIIDGPFSKLDIEFLFL